MDNAQDVSQDMVEPKPLPIWAKAISDINPSPFVAVVGQRAFKGTNTIMHGGWGPDDKIRFRDNLNPRSLLKHKNLSAFNEQGFVARSIFNNEKGTAGFIGKRLGVEAPIWNAGHMARIGAAQSTMSNFSPNVAARTSEFIGKTAPDLYNNLAYGATQWAPGTAADAAMSHLMSPNGRISQRIMGRMSRRIEMSPEMESAGNALRPEFMAARARQVNGLSYGEGGIKGMWEKASVKVAEKQAEKAGAQKLIMGTTEKVAGEEVGQLATRAIAGTFTKLGMDWAAAQSLDVIPPLIPVVETAMTIYTAYTLAKTAASLTKDLVINPLAEEAKQGFNSFKGGIDKSPFGMGYKDTEAGMTSRARGVMAIQNSRLNARSVLGNEASSLHAHFG